MAEFVSSVLDVAGASQSASQSCGISGGGEFIVFTDKHVNGFGDLAQVISGRVRLSIDLLVTSSSVIKHAEIRVVEHLRPIVHVLKTGSSGVVTRGDGESVDIVNRSLGIRQKSNSFNAHVKGKNTDVLPQFSGAVSHPAKLLSVQEIAVFDEDVASLDPATDFNNYGGAVLEENSGSKSNKLVEVGNNSWITSGQGSKHDGSSFTVTNVVNLLTGLLGNILESSREIIFRHLLPREVPEGRIGIRGVEVDGVNVTKTVLVTSVVGDPDIIAGVSDKEASSLFFVVDDPGVRRVEEAVVEQNSG